MSDSIADLLAKRRVDEPPEIKIIQEYIMAKYQVKPQVTIAQRQITISVKSAALAGALRPELLQIQAACQTDKRLVLRIQ